MSKFITHFTASLQHNCITCVQSTSHSALKSNQTSSPNTKFGEQPLKSLQTPPASEVGFLEQVL